MLPSDIDECSLLNGGCHQICSNRIGGFDCSCEEGYTINTDNRTCQGIMTMYCYHKPLIYLCKFIYPLHLFIHAVDPIAMCDASNSCAQSCVRLSGVETCGCLPGYELASNGMNCTSKFSKAVEKQLCALGTDAVFNGMYSNNYKSKPLLYRPIFWNGILYMRLPL